MKHDPQRVAEIIQAMKETRHERWRSFRIHWPMYVFEFAKDAILEVGFGFVAGLALALSAVVYGLEVLAA